MQFDSFVTVSGSRLMLGDREVKLKGINYDDPDSPWAAFKRWNPDAAREGLALAASIGINSVRVESREDTGDMVPKLAEFLDIAQEHGIRVYAVPNWPHTFPDPQSVPEPGTLEDEENLDFVKRFFGAFRDDPRIIGYDLLNEADWISHEHWQWEQEPETAAKRLVWFRRMYDAIKEVDENHLVTMGATFSYSYWRPSQPFTLESFVDLVDFHYYRRNYRESTMREEIRRVKEHTGKPIILGEFGFSSCPKFSTKGEPVHSEEMQERMYREYISDCVAEDISGVMPWNLIDYREELHDGESLHGLFRIDGSPKPAALLYGRELQVEKLW